MLLRILPINELIIIESKEPDSAFFANSRAYNRNSSGQIKSIIELIRDLRDTNILTFFVADWLLFVDARV